MYRFVKKYKTLFLSLGFLILFSITVTYATPPGSPYNAGETLDPGCAPGTTNCTVSVGGGGSSPWDTVSGGINYAGGNVGIGRTTPGSALDVNGAITSTGLQVNGTSSSSTTTVATVANPHATIVYDNSYNHIANGYAYKYKVYAYKIVNGNRVYSSTASFTSQVIDDSSVANYGVSVSWDAVSGADGYRVLAYSSDPSEQVAIAPSSFFDNFTAYADALPLAGSFDVVGTSFVDDGCGSTCPSSDVIVTPTSITTTIQGSMINGGLTVSGNATFDDTIVATGTFGSGTAVPDLGAGTRMMWIPSVAAFRAGQASTDEFDSINVGQYSVAFGLNTIASGQASVAFGANSVASNIGAIAFGVNVQATGSGAVAFGNGTQAIGANSTTFGINTTAQGAWSTAFGVSSQANGVGSIAFGFTNIAGGDFSTAFGRFSQANGYNSAVFGDTTVASGESSFAAGKNTLASGDFSAAFGQGSVASGFGSFATYGGQALGLGTFATGFATATAHSSAAFGGLNVGGGDPDHWVPTDLLFEIGNGQPGGSTPSDALSVLKNGKVGIGTATPTAALDIEGDGTIIAAGTYASGAPVPDLGAGVRMEWIPSALAFRAGWVLGNQWDSANVGVGSAAFGFNTIASGGASTAFGQSTTASADFSFTAGYSTTASGNGSTAFGNTTTASGDSSFAMGSGTTASGLASSAFGFVTTADAFTEAVFGSFNIPSGGNPTVWIPTDPIFEIGNSIDSNNPSNALTVLKNGNVGIGIATPGVLLSVGSSTATSGNVAHFETSAAHCDLDPTTTGGLTCSSDMNLKKNITNLADNSAWSFNTNVTTSNQSILDKVVALQPVQYNWNTDQADVFGNVNAPKHDGFIAQDVQKLFPELVTTDAKGSEALNYTGLIPYTVEAIKEMNVNIINIADLTKTNTWRDAIMNWLGSTTNGITNIFSKQVTTPTLCVGTNDNKTCITKDQLDHLLQQQSDSGTTTVITNNSSSSDSSSTSTDDQTQSGDVTPVVVQSPEVSDPVVPDPVPDTTKTSSDNSSTDSGQ